MPSDLDATASSPVWYVASPEGKQEGPFSLADVRSRFQAGRLTASQLVWKEGMAGWSAASSVDGLLPPLATTSPTPAPPPSSAPASGTASPAPGTASSPPAAGPPPQFTATGAPVDQLLARIVAPGFFRNMGRSCGVLAIVFALASVALVFFQVYLFTQVLILALMWMVGEGTAAILESLAALAHAKSSVMNDDVPKS